MILSMKERSQILGLLPQDGKREIHHLLDDLAKDLQFSKEEMKVTRYTESGHPFQDSEGKVSIVPFGVNGENLSMWDASKDVSKE